MLGKVLIVDQVVTNRIALRAKLGAAQFDVWQASRRSEAIKLVAKHNPDLILTASMLPDGDAVSLIADLDRSLKGPRPPVIVICGQNCTVERLDFLRAGAEDAVCNPINQTLLLARIRTLVRAATSESEWQLRDDTTRALGFAEAASTFQMAQSVALIGSDKRYLMQLACDIKSELPHVSTYVTVQGDPIQTGKNAADAYILVFEETDVQDILRLMSALRCHRASRNAGIFVIQAKSDPELSAYALDMGANDLVLQESCPTEIALRLSALLKRKRQADQLRTTLKSGLEAAVSDPLTGLHNRRYAMPHMERLLERAQRTSRPLAVMLADMDFFKQINDRYGHAAGDAVLVETAQRLRENLRAVDLVARIGGEEFLIVLPNATLPNAQKAAQRLCKLIHDTPFTVPDCDQKIPASISIGLAVFDPEKSQMKDFSSVSPDILISRADEALYLAKEKGRNRVRLARPAA